MAALTQRQGELRRDEPMHRHTTWRVGGPADLYFRPHDLDDLVLFMREHDGAADALWVGLGSNLLVRDGGYRGVVISTYRALSTMDMIDDATLHVGAGVACAKLAKHCATHGIGPAEFFAGIPGTVGGALAMNAGAFDGETWRFVREVQTLDANGRLRTRAASDYAVGYREVRAPAGEWFVSATFEFAPQAADGRKAIRALLDKRKATQPIGEPSCGSVFRNPDGDYAARLIEAAGLKGIRVGGAEVSPKHANFIINTGDATASDIEALMALVRNVVAEDSGIELIAEVRIVGEFQ
ncbi:MAG: UDP-N-acetylmuramate dehydrogenase [Pseudomonadota bacterium]